MKQNPFTEQNDAHSYVQKDIIACQINFTINYKNIILFQNLNLLVTMAKKFEIDFMSLYNVRIY